MTIVILGIDLGKNSCSLVGLDGAGSVLLRRRMRRESVAGFVEGLPRCVVAMEACCGAHHLGRVFAAHGHEVRLMSPEYVRPYVKAQKNDDRDAEAIAEAATRPTMRFVPVKSEAQSDIQALHRARARLIAEELAGRQEDERQDRGQPQPAEMRAHVLGHQPAEQTVAGDILGRFGGGRRPERGERHARCTQRRQERLCQIGGIDEIP